jgi:tetratricopeptide (TPR) repeat protein
MTWDGRRLLSVVDGIEGRGDPVRAWETPRFAAAAWLHTDAALRFVADGNRDGASAQLDAASRVFRAGGERTTSVARQWYFAVVRDLRDRQWLATAERLLEFGRERMPGDPVVLRESGMLAELLSTDPLIPPARAGLDDGDELRRRGVATEPFLVLAERRRRHLDEAARWLRASLDADPSSVDARLHLGRVASLLDLDEGRSLLDGLRPSEPPYAYLAAMFLGAAAERAGNLGLAEARYREAIVRLPEGHAAYMALCRLLQLTGRVDAARTLLESAARRRGTRREPWWWYFYEAPGLAAARVEARREEARR